ncbi:MAG: translocation/assembly module TamB domain-containing protein, partial [Bacteroidota bacterium]|nr:translocation/assembly module TamB domain-containing protein [Bacteroidota bacterium]
PKSHIGNYYAMRFDDFNVDMNEYVDSVVMDANFKNSTVSSDDIAFFAPELKNWKKQAEISGHFYGKVVDFSVPNLFIRSGSDMYATGELKMKNLPDIDNTIITLNNGNVQMSYTDLITIIPQLKDITSPNLTSLGLFRYNGNFNGTIYRFSANGNISSAIGGISANINMQFPNKGEPRYSGKIITQQFDLGKFTNTPSIGLVSFNGAVSGSSFDIDKVKTALNGTFSRFGFNDYNYSNIDFNGTIQNKFFNGDLKISDPNFDFTSNVEIDLTGSQPKFNVLGDLAKSNLQALHLINENFQLAGLFDLNFEGKNIDEFRGYVKILNAVLLHDSTRLSFDSLAVTSYNDSINKRVLFAQSNEFDVMVSGQYNILDLPNSFQAFLNHYYPSYINKPKTTPKNQNFSVAVNTRDFDNYAQVIDARLHGLDNAQLTGSVNTEDSGTFTLSAYVPDFGWGNLSVENATFRGTGNFVSLNVTGNVDKIQVSDSTYFPNTKLSIQSANDHSVLHVETSANNTLNNAQLNADVYTLPDGVKIDFQPSSFVINEKKWDLEKEGEIVIRKGFATAQNVKFIQGFQEITVEPDDTQQNKGNSLVVRLKDVNVGDFTPIFTKEPRIEGIANGNIYLSDFYGNFRMEADINAGQFRVNDDSIGIVNASAAYNIANGNIDFSAQSNNPSYNFDISGGANVKDTTGAGVNIAMHLNKTKIVLVNMFLSDLFSNITGLATGDLSVVSNKEGLNLGGSVAVEKAAITVNYTQVRYTIDSARFVFTDAGIDFGTFIIKDDGNRTATVRGKLTEHNFSHMQYDFDMATDKLLLLNTTAKDNGQFYGRAIGRATLSLKGPQENMKLNITGSVNDSTHIYIPTGNSSKSSAADFVVFKQYGILQKALSASEQSNLSIDLDLTANNQAQIDVILDPVTGDIIKANGNGRMQIKVPATGSMSMKGRYNIEHGDYDFNFQSFLRRPFELLPDSYIEWNGDPYDADIHIDAQYTAERVSINDLISNQSATNSVDNAFSNVSGYRGDVYVIAQLRDKLTQPKITFRLDFPQGSAIKNDNNFNLFLARLQSDDNEMLKQVTYLIVFNSFAPYGEVTGASTNAYSLGVNTLSQKITSEVNKIISNVLYKITGDKNLQLDIAASTYSSSSINGATSYTGSSVLDRQQIGLKINKSLLDGKVIITFGGDFDFGISNASASQTNNFQWLPDVSVQIILSKDRKLRAIVFNRSSLTVAGNTGATGSLGRSTRQGISLSYTKDFEKLKYLWKNKKDTPKK